MGKPVMVATHKRYTCMDCHAEALLRGEAWQHTSLGYSGWRCDACKPRFYAAVQQEIAALNRRLGGC